MESRILSAAHAKQSGVDEPWGDGNEAWWDWYLSLADHDDAPSELVALQPPKDPAAGLPSLATLRDELEVVVAALTGRAHPIGAGRLGSVDERLRLIHEAVFGVAIDQPPVAVVPGDAA